MFKLHSVWCQVFNIKQFREFCYLKQKGFRFIPDFHSRNFLYGLETLNQEKKCKREGYWRSDHLPFGRKTHGSLHAFRNHPTVGGVTLCCSTRKSPFCLETAAGSNMMILFFSESTELKDPARMSSSLPPSPFLPLSWRHFLSPYVCKVKFAANEKVKNREANWKSHKLHIVFPLLFRKPPEPDNPIIFEAWLMIFECSMAYQKSLGIHSRLWYSIKPVLG